MLLQKYDTILQSLNTCLIPETLCISNLEGISFVYTYLGAKSSILEGLNTT